jgi:hypothetical protein
MGFWAAREGIVGNNKRTYKRALESLLNGIEEREPQGGSGIRMPDRTPVGWLPPEARKNKKKKGRQHFFAF